MDGWDLTWVEHRGRNVACGQAGQGKPILMLDAWTTNLDEELDEPGRSAILRRVASSARLIRWDRSGMGLSDRCPPPASEAITEDST